MHSVCVNSIILAGGAIMLFHDEPDVYNKSSKRAWYQKPHDVPLSISRVIIEHGQEKGQRLSECYHPDLVKSKALRAYKVLENNHYRLQTGTIQHSSFKTDGASK